ncbi:MAG: pyridoxal-phosphate dependent enzyme [Candidatus Levybacteria bacterium]|nr:pyridoxal-phosphate dependent enzyme [Candidatus Levybacteria bacterium]
MTEARPQGYIYTTFQRDLGIRERTAGIRPASELATAQNRTAQYESLRNLVFSITPLISDIQPNGSAILYKYESYRPSGSHYDPVYFNTLSTLEKDGVIKQGDDLYEVTSGSAGTSFAWMSSRLGYKAHIYVPTRLDVARKQEMINFGAELVEIGDENAYIPEASRAETRAFIREARETDHDILDPIRNGDFNLFLARDKYGHTMALVNHSENGITPRAMEDLIDQAWVNVPEGVNVDNIVSVIGNGSSSTGIYHARNRRFPGAKIIGVESQDNAVLFRDKYPGRAEELGLVFKPQIMPGSIIPGMKLPFLDHAVFDEIRLVNVNNAIVRMKFHNGRCLSVAESIGITSAASMIIADQIAREQPGSVTLAFVYDGGYRYGEPTVETGKYDKTFFTHNRRKMPLAVPWHQARSSDLEDMPHTIGEAFHRIRPRPTSI